MLFNYYHMKILIINQHGENRGDESAFNGMIYGIEKNLNVKCEFTVLGQFKDKKYKISTKNKNTKFINIVFSPFKYLSFFVYIFLLQLTGLNLSFLLNRTLNTILNEYKKSNIVISAPGAGYIGDIYKNHEFIHLFYIYLAKIYNKKLMLYSPSIGPFNYFLLNYFRKKILKLFDCITLRESHSVKYLKKLDSNINASISADSSLQLPVSAFRNKVGKKKNSFIISIVCSDFKYKNNYHEKKNFYIKCLIELIINLNKSKKVHCIFIPQLVGRVHDDYKFQKAIAKMLPANISWEILDKKFDSTYQKKIFASSDFAISSRYHPGIFATSASIPGIFFAYEHKQIGYFNDIKYKYFYDINNIRIKKVLKDTKYILKNYSKIKNELRKNIKTLIKRSELSSKLVKELLASF